MMSPHTHVALKYVSDEESARRAARRPDALPEPEEHPAEAAAQGAQARTRILARLHLSPLHRA
jgi:hypothetical protein